jgi:signal transduction histidine kinase
MALSRLRLRLTAGFAVAFFVGIAAVEGASYVYVVWTGSYDFNDRLKVAVKSERSVIRREADRIRIDSTIFDGVRGAMEEFTPSKMAFVVYDSAGARLATGGDTAIVRLIPPADSLNPNANDIDVLPLPDRLQLRWASDTVIGMHVVAAATTEVLRRRHQKTLTRLALLVPVVLLVALTIGYRLSRAALDPIDALGRAAREISPGELAGRLPVHDQPDEVDRLAMRFNGLLDRIQGLQEQSHRFLREVAHQIRTPLTLVLGEAALGLERERTPEEYVRILGRIHAAAGQMTHRVQDLMLLARMEAGERPPLRDAVELDALALEATDMFRSRAQALGQHLELHEIIPCEVTGDEALLREALLELLENACRHGEPGTPVGVSVSREGTSILLGVRSTGAAIPPETTLAQRAGESGRTGGLGLSIIRWIASVHGGELVIRRVDRENLVGLRLPDRLVPATAELAT